MSDKAFEQDAGKAQKQEGVSLETFLASLSVAAIVFGVEVVIFVIIRRKLNRMYEPRTYLVPEKRRTVAPGRGLLDWIKPVLHTSSSDFIAKSGLDAYFFLRYLLMLLKLFGILAIVILPILLPLNSIGGRGEADPVEPVRGLDKLAWTNVAAEDTKRYWAHLLLAVGTIILCCYMFYTELKVYIRLRQAYLTSPQHRLRASATTVLVTAIPRKWLTVKMLLGLYDVFPGGVRNIWVNRDYDELAEKVSLRDDLARKLEKAETELIQMAKKKQLREAAKVAKSDPGAQVAATRDMSHEGGLSSGNPGQIPDKGDRGDVRNLDRTETTVKKSNIPKPIGEGLGKIGSGFNRVGRKLKKEVMDIVPGKQRAQGEDTSSSSDSSSDDDEGHFPSNPSRGSTLLEQGQQNGNGHSHDAEVDGSSKKHGKSRKRSKKFNTDDDDRPLAAATPVTPTRPPSSDHGHRFNPFAKDKAEKVYPQAFNAEFENDNYGEPVWKKYLRDQDRPTMRLPLAGWMPSLPLIGQKVDTIHYCRKEVARLNVEIEQDQKEPEKFPLMNSAFIQFNNQVAAHMACQSLNHHIPQHMAPRYLEVNPNDVIWENMRMKWWERYIRAALITVMVAGLIIGWAFPVTFVGLVSQLSYLEGISWLTWIGKLPQWLLGLISGVLPPLGLAILMALLPIILRTFARIQGLHTGMSIELAVQGMYFAFLFVQVFLVVSISSGITSVISDLTESPTSAPTILAQNLPKASNFFFSYLLLQAFAQSGGALLQIGGLFVNYILAPILDSTARQKWSRQTNLNDVKWGTFFPVYTNLACIGLVYSVISPLILVFNIFTFALFWIVFRYNLLYVNNFKFDTGGLLFPRAINQLFTGLYVMEVCLIGLFFLVRDQDGNVACFPQAIIMIIMAGFTIIYQSTLNRAFGPLLTYLPITLEDDAVAQDKKFAKEQNEHRRLMMVEEEQEGDNINDVLKQREQRERQEEHEAEGIEMQNIQAHKEGNHTHQKSTSTSDQYHAGDPSFFSIPGVTKKHFSHAPKPTPTQKTEKDPESQLPNHQKYGTALFDHIPDDIEDLSPKERDKLVGRAFQHSALRAKRPVIWIPRDDLGISDDEIYRTQRLSKHIWISNEYTGLDERGKVTYRRSPPDFDQRDLVEL